VTMFFGYKSLATPDDWRGLAGEKRARRVAVDRSLLLVPPRYRGTPGVDQSRTRGRLLPGPALSVLNGPRTLCGTVHICRTVRP
jgi:hypothetical protein